ncbi:MAG: hypothetical protein EAZ55_07750 [Cytophagales bacterium]|nr:MAG: hypothetical protein EAZ55_07750 [Cytophagales bacterium]
MKNFIINYGLIIASAFLDSYAAFVMKKQFNKLGLIDYSTLESVLIYLYKFIQNPLLITAVIGFIVAPLLSFLAFNRLELSVGYPILVGFHLVFGFMFSALFLEENLTTYKIIGCILIFISLYLFYRTS